VHYLGHTQLKTSQRYSHLSNETLLAAVDASANATGTDWGAARTAKAGDNSALGQGKKRPAEWAKLAWQVLAEQGQKIVKEGKTLETAEENLAELTALAQTFAEKQLPVLKALQIV